MKTEFSTAWKSSKNPRKQRKYQYNAPLHIKQKFVKAHLTKELRIRYKKRSLRLRKGDTIKIMRGQFKKKTGKVERVDVKHAKIYITGIAITKKDGSKKPRALHPSNLLITELNLEDKKRQKGLIGK